MASALSLCRGDSGMSDGDGANQAQDLREHAAFLLREAARCGDPGQRDSLLREAMARLGEARRLLDRLDDALGRLGPGPPWRSGQ